jgi:hypothetical protein
MILKVLKIMQLSKALPAASWGLWSAAKIRICIAFVQEIIVTKTKLALS